VQFTVSPAVLAQMTISPQPATVFDGLTQQFHATGTYTDGSHADVTSQVTWSSLNTAYATIGSDGKATGVKGGSTAIRALDTASGVSTQATLTVFMTEVSYMTAAPEFLASPAIPTTSLMVRVHISSNVALVRVYLHD